MDGGIVTVDVGNDEVLADGALQVLGRALGDQAASVDDPDPVGQGVGLVEVLGREEDGHPQLGVEPADLGPDAGPAQRVETGRRLVEEQHLGAVDEGRREVEPALHPARVGADPPIDRIADVDQVEHLVSRLRISSRSEAVEAALEA